MYPFPRRDRQSGESGICDRPNGGNHDDCDQTVPKEKALVGIGAAVAAGCQPCTTRLLQLARAAGACERGIRLAIETGLATRSSAAEAMGQWAQAEQGQAPLLDESFRSEKQTLVALIAATAAFSANSKATLEGQIAVAEAHDWTKDQIAEALAGGTHRVEDRCGEDRSGGDSNGICAGRLSPWLLRRPARSSGVNGPTQSNCGCADTAEV